MRWKRTRNRNRGAKNGVTLGGWEEAARGEAVEAGPSGEEVGLGEACPASWTCPAKTREVERYGMFTEMTEDNLNHSKHVFKPHYPMEIFSVSKLFLCVLDYGKPSEHFVGSTSNGVFMQSYPSLVFVAC